MVKKSILCGIGLLLIALLIFGCKKPTIPTAPTPEEVPAIEVPEEVEEVVPEEAVAKPEKVLLIVAQKAFQPVEYSKAREALEAEGIVVDVASPNGGTATATSGLTVETIPIADVNVDNYIAIVIIGGPGTRLNLAGTEGLNELISSAAEKGKIVAAICLAPTILAEAGILDGVKATVWPAPVYKKMLTDNGAIFVDEYVVTDGKIITAQGPTAAKEFATTVTETVKAELG